MHLKFKVLVLGTLHQGTLNFRSVPICLLDRSDVWGAFRAHEILRRFWDV